MLDVLLRELSAGREVVRAVILRTWGSTPREVGADMVLTMDGGLHGTVGGGCGEAEVYDLAQTLLHDPSSPSGFILHVDLTEDPELGGGKVCGGRFDVLLHRLNPAEHLALFETEQRFDVGKDSLLLRSDLGEVSTGFWKEGLERVACTPVLSLQKVHFSEPTLQVEDGGSQFWEPIGSIRTLVIVGAGHISRPLCAMAGLTGYRVVILDDREEYARKEFFPSADEVVCDRYETALPFLVRAERVSVVLVTRGHKHDQDCLRLIAGQSLDYVGMIGSQRRIDAVYKELMEEGVSSAWLQQVCAPIGLEIGAQTPAEIAVCILAQMIQRRRCPEATAFGVRPRKRHLRSLGI